MNEGYCKKCGGTYDIPQGICPDCKPIKEHFTKKGYCKKCGNTCYLTQELCKVCSITESQVEPEKEKPYIRESLEIKADLDNLIEGIPGSIEHVFKLRKCLKGLRDQLGIGIVDEKQAEEMLEQIHGDLNTIFEEGGMGN